MRSGQQVRSDTDDCGLVVMAGVIIPTSHDFGTRSTVGGNGFGNVCCDKVFGLQRGMRIHLEETYHVYIHGEGRARVEVFEYVRVGGHSLPSLFLPRPAKRLPLPRHNQQPLPKKHQRSRRKPLPPPAPTHRVSEPARSIVREVGRNTQFASP